MKSKQLKMLKKVKKSFKKVKKSLKKFKKIIVRRYPLERINKN